MGREARKKSTQRRPAGRRLSRSAASAQAGTARAGSKAARKLPSGRVGVYWVTPGRGLVAFGEAVEGVNDVGGFRDSDLAHVELWRTVVSAEPGLSGLEYYEVPRGRVLFVVATGKFRVLSSRALCGSRRHVRAVKLAFGLAGQAVEAMPDEHYELTDDDDEADV